MYYSVELGKNIVILRKAKGLSQEKLAELAEISVTWMRHIEHDCANVTFSRKIIAHKISRRSSTQLITSTFRSAYASRRPDVGLTFHSDQGSQYTSYAFRVLLEKLQVTQSFSKSGRPYDNAVAESFFSIFKKEEFCRTNYRSEKELYQGIDRYIIFYNEKRPHTTLKNKTPEQFEANFLPQSI